MGTLRCRLPRSSVAGCTIYNFTILPGVFLELMVHSLDHMVKNPPVFPKHRDMVGKREKNPHNPVKRHAPGYCLALSVCSIRINAAFACSSLTVGSRNRLNRSHIRSGHLPQCGSLRSFTQQSYTGQHSTPAYDVQNGFPFVASHPGHSSPRWSHPLQEYPQTVSVVSLVILWYIQ